jgi:hypothetical protein
MVEKNQVLMDLSHIADVWHDWKIEDFGQKTDGQELAHACHSRTVNLESSRAMEVALEDASETPF